jgi:hypothetical protein
MSYCHECYKCNGHIPGCPEDDGEYDENGELIPYDGDYDESVDDIPECHV